MAPTISPSELWAHYSMPNVVEIDCLLPNGLVITIECSRDSTLSELRTKLWSEAKKYPFFEKLKPADNYVLVSVGHDAQIIEFYDLSKRLSELKLFYAFFKIQECQGNLEEKLVDSNISKVIGIFVGDLDQVKEREFMEFRLELLNLVKQNLHNEQEKLIESSYGANVEVNSNLLGLGERNKGEVSYLSLINQLNKQAHLNAEISICVKEINKEELVYKLNVPLSFTPADIIVSIIQMKLTASGYSKVEQIEEIIEKYKDAYVLNACGCDEVFYGNRYPIGSYKYFQKRYSAGKKLSFHLITVEKLKTKLPKQDFVSYDLILKYIKNLELNLSTNSSSIAATKTELSWNIKETLSIYFDSLVYLPPLRDFDRIYFKLAFYHGQELLVEEIYTERVDIERLGRDSSLRLSQAVNLGVGIDSLHRCTKLCLGLFCDSSKRKRESISIGWISLNLFDYKGCLISGKKNLYLWPTSQSSFQNLCFTDATGSNPKKDFTLVNLEFVSSKPHTQIVYPSVEFIKSCALKSSENSQDDCLDLSYVPENDNNLLESILNKDALAELTEQDKTVLWRRREDCLNYPHSLPKLLQAVRWSNKDDVIEIYHLISKWADVKPIVAIELLHSIHADIEVRNFAIKCLDKQMKNEEVKQYLLQLVQALKNEPSFSNALTRFLLSRALKSQRIGFDLFWHLRSEISNAKYRLRFGAILEAYCRGIATQLNDLMRQVDVVEKLSILAQEIKSNSDNIALVKSSFLKETLEKQDFKETLSNFISPLNRSDILGSINADKCRILTSAKRPLYLTWNNNSEYASLYERHFELIFKHGDDLRQDMLTLQILKLMDIIWKNEGLDLKLIVYDCFSTGSKTGFIEVIKDSLTLFKIQMEGGMKGKYQIEAIQLYKWIAANNSDQEKLENAIDLFTKSCAGYCVATFILGIGDRHPDNIMVNREGRIFHIDFGHFLGNFKKKYGIKRERVPFVLTEDFMKVISKGAANPIETPEFIQFQKICEQAYMIIRKYSHLIINLFGLMLSSDMPELQSIEDIMYLRKTLAVDETDENALNNFREKFTESYKFSFTTKFDWFFHALNKKNQI